MWMHRKTHSDIVTMIETSIRLHFDIRLYYILLTEQASCHFSEMRPSTFKVNYLAEEKISTFNQLNFLCRSKAIMWWNYVTKWYTIRLEIIPFQHHMLDQKYHIWKNHPYEHLLEPNHLSLVFTEIHKMNFYWYQNETSVVVVILNHRLQ